MLGKLEDRVLEKTEYQGEQELAGLEGLKEKAPQVKQKQELSKQRTRLEELEALAWLKTAGILLNDFFNSKMLTKIKAEPNNSAQVLDMLKAKVLGMPGTSRPRRWKCPSS